MLRLIAKTKLILTVLLLVFSAQAQSQGAKFNEAAARPESVALRLQLEDVIAKRYRERILTQVPTELFNVAAQVELQEVDPTKKAAASTAESMASGMSLGIVEAVDLPSIPTEVKNSFQIRKVSIVVGLSSKFGEEYEQKFKAWLTSTVKAEFGKAGDVKFSKIVPLPKEEEPKKQPETPRPLSFEEKFGHFQNILGFGLFSLFLLAGILLMKFLPSRDMKEQMNVALRLQEMKNSQLQLSQADNKLSAAAKDKPQDSKLSPNLLFESLKEHQRKVALLSFSNAELMDRVFDRWFDEGDEGRKKVASLIDSLLIQVGPAVGNPQSTLSWTLPERIKKDKELPDVFQAFSTMSLLEKAALAEKTYWDLLAVKTLGEQMSRNLFASVASLSSQKITKLLSNQDQKTKSVAVLHLPQEKMEQVIAEMSFEEKKSVVIEALDSPAINPKELELADESLRFLVKQEQKQDDGSIELQSMVPQVLMCLNPLEEIQLLQQILPRLADRGGYLRQNFPTFVFLAEWPEDKIKSFLGTAQPQDVLCLLKTLPELTDYILPVLPSRSQIIIKDSMSKEIAEDELIRGLNVLKMKMYKMVNDGQLSLTQIFPQQQVTQAQAA